MDRNSSKLMQFIEKQKKRIEDECEMLQNLSGMNQFGTAF